MIQLLPIVLAQVALMAGGPVKAQCSPDLGQDTWGNVGGGVISLIDFGCQDVNRFSRTRHLPKAAPYRGMIHDRGAETVDSLMILVHEVGHIRHPESTEACVKRYAVRHVGFFARGLGASRKTARRIVELAYAEWRIMPGNYRGCKKR